MSTTGVSRIVIIAMIISPILCVAPPGIPEISSPSKIILGDSVTLSCNVTGGDPVPAVVWFRDSRPIDNSSTTINGITVNTYTFTATQEEHLEVFECKTDNKITQNALIRTKFVEVYSRPQVPTLTGPSVLMSGSTGTWQCISTRGYPQPAMAMRIGNTALSSQATFSTVYDSISKSYTVTGTLIWAPSTVHNGQTLFCDVFHSATSSNNVPQTVSLHLSINAPFSVYAPGTHYTPMVGESVALNCVITSGNAAALYWYKDGQRVSISAEPRYSGGSVNNPPLTITQVQERDGGAYICQASDGTQKFNTSVITLAPRAPLRISAPITSYRPFVDDSVALNCVVTSGTAIQIRWFKDTALINVSTNSRFNGGTVNDPTLRITQVQANDAGTYVCEAYDGIARVTIDGITLSPRDKMVIIDDVMLDFLQNYNKYARPATIEVPVVQLVHDVSIVRIEEFDYSKLVLYAGQGLFWNDPRLRWTGEPSKISLPSSVVWTPDVIPLYEDVNQSFEPKVLVTKNGDVSWYLSGNLTSSRCAMKTGEVTECIFKILSWTYDKGMVDITFPADGTRPSVELRNYEEHADYEIVSTCAIREEKQYPCCTEIYPTLHYKVVLKRRPKVYADIATCTAR